MMVVYCHCHFVKLVICHCQEILDVSIPDVLVFIMSIASVFLNFVIFRVFLWHVISTVPNMLILASIAETVARIALFFLCFLNYPWLPVFSKGNFTAITMLAWYIWFGEIYGKQFIIMNEIFCFFMSMSSNSYMHVLPNENILLNILFLSME